MMWLLLLHAAATLAMTGIIWFVQLVHYPLFHYVEARNFSAFAAAHQKRTTWVVMPLMSVELVTAIALALGAAKVKSLALSGLFLLVGIWLSTALVQMPLHRRLTLAFDRRVVRSLVRSNGFRTAAWSVRSILALELLVV